MTRRAYLIVCAVLALATALLSSAHAALSLSGASVGTGSVWTALGSNFDDFNDLSNDPSSNIVGNATNKGFFTAYDATDDILAFRVRLDANGGNKNSPSFDRNLWVGIDIGIDANDGGQAGRVDVFIGINRQGSGNNIIISDAGTGANTSPSTTTISSTPFVSIAINQTEGTGNYNYRAVTAADGDGTLDLTGTGSNDYYASFSINFADLVAFFVSQGTTIHESTPFRYTLATSTNVNSLNQDIGGTADGNNSTIRWDDPVNGGFSTFITATGEMVPEPSSFLLVALSSLLLMRSKRNC